MGLEDDPASKPSFQVRTVSFRAPYLLEDLTPKMVEGVGFLPQKVGVTHRVQKGYMSISVNGNRFMHLHI